MVVLFRFWYIAKSINNVKLLYLSYNINGQAFMLTLVCENMGVVKMPFDLV